MPNDLDSRIRSALGDAVSTTNVSPDAFSAILARAESARSASRPLRWAAVATLVTAATGAAIVVAMNTDQNSSGPNLAAIDPPAINLPSLSDSIENCGTVDQRAATPYETAAVGYLPAALPAGYQLSAEQPPQATVQHRAESTVDCWQADATYVDTSTRKMVTVSVVRQGHDVQPTCELPVGYLPSECTTVQDRPAGLTHGGTRTSVSWISPDGNAVNVSTYGFVDTELLAIANTVTFDGSNVGLTLPAGMALVDSTPKTRSDGRDITYYSARFDAPGDESQSSSVSLTVTTWNDVTINEAGPAATVEFGDTTAIAITTGGPDTGITGWTRPANAGGPFDVIEFDQPAHAYITWNDNGLTFRIEGPDTATVTAFASSLEPTT